MKKKLEIALAGNANVGKSLIFNYLTGLHQHVGNWAGKTVAKFEGTLHFKGRSVNVTDLPGIYSLTTFSIEEQISRDYIAREKPDVVINVVDASVLERNLFFTLQLAELERPMVIALNMADIAKKRGVEVDAEKLSRLLGIPVIPTVAVRGAGLYEMLEKAVEIAEAKRKKPARQKYKRELEKKIDGLAKLVEKVNIDYPARWAAIKLLEGDGQIKKLVGQKHPKIIALANKTVNEIEKKCGESSSIVLTSERYAIAEKIARNCERLTKPREMPLSERLDAILLHRFFGYPALAVVTLLIFLSVFSFGDLSSGYLAQSFDSLKAFYKSAFGTGPLADFVWGGVIEGVIAGITIALPYLIPFFIVLALLENSGYLARMAFLMDGVMHRMGLHGKAFIPLMLGYGCSVPGCLACRIMETERERLIAGFVVTLVPCAARTVIILGLVGAFVGLEWAAMLYLFNLLVIFALGRAAFKALPGEPMGLIMEMPSYKMPTLDGVVRESWIRVKDFIYTAFPVIIASTLLIKVIEIAGLLGPITEVLAPISVGWLGLPAVVGITLIFGILRKELILIMLVALLGTENLGSVLTPLQMITFTLVAMFYIPCAATIATLSKEYGWQKAAGITIFEIVFALLLAGTAARLLPALGIL